jgi:hypothetical protein
MADNNHLIRKQRNMTDQNSRVVKQLIENRIFTIRGLQVMLDSHLAELYDIESKRLNEQVKRNIQRFPGSFRFQLTEGEYENLKSQFATSSFEDDLSMQRNTLTDPNPLRLQTDTPASKHGGRRYLPYVFTEQGVAMLSAVLRSETAIRVSIEIIYAFVEMRKLLWNNAGLLQRMDKVEAKLIETDARFEQIFNALENRDIAPAQNIFFDGQIYDAYSFVIQLIQKAQNELILIDNYPDNTVLDMLSKKQNGVAVTLITRTATSILNTDLIKFNQQYHGLQLKHSSLMHDRFLILDRKELYHIGASLKDLGKKCFAISLINDPLLLTNLMQHI